MCGRQSGGPRGSLPQLRPQPLQLGLVPLARLPLPLRRVLQPALQRVRGRAAGPELLRQLRPPPRVADGRGWGESRNEAVQGSNPSITVRTGLADWHAQARQLAPNR